MNNAVQIREDWLNYTLHKLWGPLLTYEQGKPYEYPNLKSLVIYAHTLTSDNAYVERLVKLCNLVLGNQQKGMSILLLDNILQILCNGPVIGNLEELIYGILTVFIDIGGFDANKTYKITEESIINVVKMVEKYKVVKEGNWFDYDNANNKQESMYLH